MFYPDESAVNSLALRNPSGTFTFYGCHHRMRAIEAVLMLVGFAFTIINVTV